MTAAINNATSRAVPTKNVVSEYQGGHECDQSKYGLSGEQKTQIKAAHIAALIDCTEHADSVRPLKIATGPTAIIQLYRTPKSKQQSFNKVHGTRLL